MQKTIKVTAIAFHNKKKLINNLMGLTYSTTFLVEESTIFNLEKVDIYKTEMSNGDVECRVDVEVLV